MEDLVVEFSAGQIRGSGRDVVGDFQLQGTMEPGGQVRIIKRYLGKHQVLYVGSYDGEGTLFGTWYIEWAGGAWSIKLLRGTENTDRFEEIAPLTQST